MKRAIKAKYTPSMSDRAVESKTGRTWKQWFALLDRAGARNLEHKAIATLLGKKTPKIGGWWCQTVTVEYERARGLREKHQTTKGYQVSATRTLAVPLRLAFGAWTDSKLRRRWLPTSPIAIRKATPGKIIRIGWDDGKSSVEVRFAAKGARKSQLTVDHTRLPTAAAAARMRSYWKRRLERLDAVLET